MDAVRLRNIIKSFNGVRVLHGVDFNLRKGEVHALLGGNGAGKSTLMKILEGVYQPDGGEIEIAGQVVNSRVRRPSHELGLAMIFQEFSLIPSLSVAKNIYLTRESRTNLGLLDDRASERNAAAIFHDMGVDIDPRATVSQLSTGARQLTEIAKALSQNAQLLIMDEPTASLTSTETEALFAIIRQLKAQGISIIYISHRMEEIFQIADRVTVLRDGRNVGTKITHEVSMGELIEMIIGKQVESVLKYQERSVERETVPLLEIRELTVPPKVRTVSLKLFPGEVLGIAGLMGSGRSELARALFGIDRIASGQVLINGCPLSIKHPESAIRAGICLIPEDRRTQGLVLDHSVRNNVVLPLLDRIRKGWFMDDGQVDALSNELVERLNIRTESIYKLVKLLSGGNQQKVVLAKWLAAKPEVLIMDEPTAGVDVGAKSEIISMIRELADGGKGIILISAELPELLATCDRIAVMRGGQIDRIMLRHDISDEKELQHILHQGKYSGPQKLDTKRAGTKLQLDDEKELLNTPIRERT